jgi:hypothetical protein
MMGWLFSTTACPDLKAPTAISKNGGIRVNGFVLSKNNI